MRKYYPGITLFKFIGCILVVLSHIIIPAFYNRAYGQTYLGLFNIIGPCFFIVSGFLAYNGWSNAHNADKYISKYLYRIIIIYALFVLISIGSDLVKAAASGNIQGYFALANLKKLVVAILLQGPYVQLWFVPALIFGIAVSYYLMKKLGTNKVLILGFTVFIIAMFTVGSLHILIKNIEFGDFYGCIALREITRRFLSEGLTYVLAGVIIAKYEEGTAQINLPALIVLCICSTVAEYFLLQKLPLNIAHNTLSFSSLPNTILLFYGILRIKTKWIKQYHQIINLFTIVIFFSHYFLIYIDCRVMNLKIAHATFSEAFYLVALTFLEGAAITYLINRFNKAKSHAVTVSA